MKRVQLGRRTWLRAAGATVALPALDAMFTETGLTYSTANGQTEADPIRLVTFFIPNGVPVYYPKGRTDEYRFFPRESGKGYTVTHCLEPIAAYRSRFNILNGVVLGESCEDGHAGGTTGFATGLAPTPTGASGPSIDQVAASHLGGATRFRSLGVGVKPIDQPFNKFSIATFDELSWAAKDQVAPLRRDPRQLFNDLFADALPVDSGEAKRRQQHRRSVLDFVKGDIGRLNARLGASDRLRLDAHFTAIRDLELRAIAAAPLACTLPPEPGEGLGYVDRAKLQAELLAMALRCDLTRYGSYMYGHGGNDGGGKDSKYGLVEVLGEWPQQHNFTHALEDARRYDALFESLTKFTLTQMQVFAHFLATLQAGSAGPNDVLQNTLIYFGSELGNGVNHDNATNVLPILLVGNAGGQLVTGQHIVFPQRVRSRDVLFTALKLARVPVSSFAGTSEVVSL